MGAPLGPASISPTITSSAEAGLGLGGALPEPGWAVGWAAGGLEGAGHSLSLWHQKFRKLEGNGAQRKRKARLRLLREGARPWRELGLMTLISSSPCD